MIGAPPQWERAKAASFLFGGVSTPSLGTVRIRVPVSPTLYADLSVDVVDLDVPFLFGLDMFDELGLYVNNVEDRLKCDRRAIATPLVRKGNHIYLEWGNEAHYTTTELDRLHRHFAHPHPERLAAILRQAKDPNVTTGTRQQLDQLSEECDVCQRLARAPGRFRVALPPGDIAFNRTVLIDIMYLDGDPVLYVIDKDTRFGAAGFMSAGETAEATWKLYDRIWASVYVGHPEAMHADQGPQFRSATWAALAHSAGITLVNSGVESHNALGSGERYHAFLRNVYRRVHAEHPGLDKESMLAMAVAAVNQTAGTGGLTPTLLVFGVIPRMPVAPIRVPSQQDRSAALITARKEMAAQVARTRVRTALSTPVPADADRDVQPGTQVLVYREPPVDSRQGPYTVVVQTNKTVSVAVDGQLKTFAIDRIKAYKSPTAEATTMTRSTVPETPTVTPSDTAFPETVSASVPTDAVSGTAGNTAGLRPPEQPIVDVAPSPGDEGDLPPDGAWLDAILGSEQLLCKVHQAGEEALRRKQMPEMPGLVDEHAAVYITVDVPTGDARIKTARFRAAARKEAEGLQDRGAFRKIKRCDLPPRANVIKGRFVFTLKEFNTPEEQAKARYVAQGQLDKAKAFVVHNSSTLRQRSTRIILSTSVNHGFRIFFHDITQAYLQSQEGFTREIYLDPRPADRELFDLADDEVLLLLLPLYGVCDAGDYWIDTMSTHLRGDLAMVPLVADPSMFAERAADAKLLGMTGTYVDDLINGGGREFQILTEKTLARFQAKERKWDKGSFVGVRLATVDKPVRHFTAGQLEYVDNLAKLARTASFKDFASSRASLAWLVHTRPDLAFGINQLAQIGEASYGRAAIKS